VGRAPVTFAGVSNGESLCKLILIVGVGDERKANVR